jgi:membrane protease YdiL (CAAX protease family)
MKYLLPIFLSSALIFADSEEPIVEEVALTTQPTFTSQALPLQPQMPSQPPVLPKEYRSPYAAVGLTMILPGLGHLYLKEYLTATGLISGTVLAGSVNPMSFSNLWMYSVFASYRDVRINNNQKGYSYRMPNDDFVDLATAPFRWSVMKKPEVWGGLLASLAVAGGAIALHESVTCKIAPIASNESADLFPLQAFSIGLGEEAFFRGYLQSYFCEQMNTTSAIMLSSVVFGAAHIPNAYSFPKEDRWRYYTFSLPLITGLGGYMGWLTHKTKSLQGSVALHAWYDFTLMLVSSLAAPTAIAGGDARFAYSFEF